MRFLLDLIGGLFLIFTGLFLMLLYVCLRTKADNWFIAFTIFLFLFGLGILAIVFGVRRIMLLLKSKPDRKSL